MKKSKRIFISHASEDSYFVPLLSRLLELHGHKPWYAPHHLKTGTEVRGAIDEEMRAADVLVAVVSRYTTSSQCVATEVATFRALKPDAVLVPALLDSTDLDAVSPRLGDCQAIDFKGCLLTGFSKMFSRLDNDFLSRAELSNRRTGIERRGGRDRRIASIPQRLSVGLLVSYSRVTGRSVSEESPIDSAGLRELTGPLRAELNRYRYFDPVDGHQLDHQQVLDWAFGHLDRGLDENDRGDTIELLRGLATAICETFVVEMIDRRDSRELRGESL